MKLKYYVCIEGQYLPVNTQEEREFAASLLPSGSAVPVVKSTKRGKVTLHFPTFAFVFGKAANNEVL